MIPSLIYVAIAKVISAVKTFQIKHFLPIVLVSFLIMGTDVNPTFNNQALGKKLNDEIHQDGETRPKTSGEFSEQAKETEGRPLERIKRIGEQSVEAVEDFAKLYPDTAERSFNAPSINNKGNR
jgi:hypothetical protein